MNILDQYGNPFNDADLEEAQTADVSRYGALPKTYDAVKNLTPAKIAAAFKAAEEGDLTAQHTLFAEMEEKDPHIYSDMSKRRRSLLTLTWNVTAPNEADANETKATEWVEAHLRQMVDFDDLLYDLSDAIGHGFACEELEWMHVKTDKSRRIKNFYHRPHTWFTTDELTRSQLLLKTQDGKGEVLQPFGWITHIHKSKSGYLARSGLYRVLAWPYMFKHFALGDWAEFLETYGMPIRLGKYPVGATAKEKQTLFAAVMALGRNAAATMPETMSVEFMNAASKANGSHDPFKAMAEWADTAISKAILGGTLTSQADGKTSTNALGNVHNEVRKELIVADAKQLAGTLTRDLVYPLLVLNGFNVDYMRCPRFTFDLEDSADITAMSEALPKLAGVMDIPADWAYQKLGIPQPKDGDVVLRATAAPQPASNDAQDTNNGQDAVKNNKEDKGKKAKLTALLSRVTDKQVADNPAPKHPFEQLLDAELPDTADAMEAALAPIFEAVRDGQTPDEVAEALLQAYPKMDLSALEETLTRVFFVADVWARLHPVDGSGVDHA